MKVFDKRKIIESCKYFETMYNWYKDQYNKYPNKYYYDKMNYRRRERDHYMNILTV